MGKIYLALDFPNWEESKNFLDKHDLAGVPVKVGMELFYREGIDVIKRLKEDNHSIFLDLKLHDIPTTVYRSMKNLANLGVDLVNVHALGGSEMIKRAKEGLQSGQVSSQATKLIAVTILTSMNKEQMNKELLLAGQLEDHTVSLAELANNNGADGVVCSVHEAAAIKEACGDEFLTVTPGIRLKSSAKDDQVRVATPSFARENKADMLVIGRSITKAINPKAAYEQALKEWNNELRN